MKKEKLKNALGNAKSRSELRRLEVLFPELVKEVKKEQECGTVPEMDKGT
jgi:hypothetical protein